MKMSSKFKLMIFTYYIQNLFMFLFKNLITFTYYFAITIHLKNLANQLCRNN